MSDEFNFEMVVRRLTDEDAQRVGGTLNVLREQPLGDIRILPYLEKLLDDTRFYITQIPYRYGHIRRVAGKALAAERNVHGIEEPVQVINTFLPLSLAELGKLADEAGISFVGRTRFEVLELLIERGILRTVNWRFFPRGDFGLSLQNKSNTQE